MSQEHWDNLLKKLLSDDENPCLECAVQVMCQKSFTHRRGGGCPELKEAIKEALRREHYVDYEN